MRGRSLLGGGVYGSGADDESAGFGSTALGSDLPGEAPLFGAESGFGPPMRSSILREGATTTGSSAGEVSGTIFFGFADLVDARKAIKQ
jgi:hypothetical protein